MPRTANRASLPLCAAYIGLYIWLAHCAVQSGLNGAWWASSIFFLGSCLVLAAFCREDRLADALRREAVRAEREARPALSHEETVDGVVAVALAGECCEMWWTSAGVEHDETCQRRTPKSSAA